jgi:hypothetical protein
MIEIETEVKNLKIYLRSSICCPSFHFCYSSLLALHIRLTFILYLCPCGESAGSLYPKQISLVASKLEVLSRRTTWYKFAVHSSHIANDGLQLGKKGLKVE